MAEVLGSSLPAILFRPLSPHPLWFLTLWKVEREGAQMAQIHFGVKKHRENQGQQMTNIRDGGKPDIFEFREIRLAMRKANTARREEMNSFQLFIFRYS